MSPEPPASQGAVQENIKRWFELGPEDRKPLWVISLKEDARVVGLIFFVHLDRVHSSGRLSYEVAREQWRKGIATEAVRAVLSYGFGTMGLNRIDACCWTGNAASQRVMEKAGMRYEGTLRQLAYAKGAYRDLRYYSMLTGEWRVDQGGYLAQPQMP
jgi:[ribosomal protein S5]-alanine N-acetyltransferase